MPNRGVAFETMRSDGVKRLGVVSEALHFPSRAPHFVLGRWLFGPRSARFGADGARGESERPRLDHRPSAPLRFLAR